MHRTRVAAATVLLGAVPAALLAGCGRHDRPATAPPAPPPGGAVLVGDAVGPRTPEALVNLRRAEMQVTATDVVATFTTWRPLDRTALGDASCELVGIGFYDGGIALQSSDHYRETAQTVVTPDPSDISYPTDHELRMTVPLSAIGASLRSGTPWWAYSIGPGCPPMAVRGDSLPEATLHPVGQR